jgi:hypothetical protein
MSSFMENYYGTLSQTITSLKELGYVLGFNNRDECLVCHQKPIVLAPESFVIDAVYRFEGASNPDDEAVVYAISSGLYNVKGSQ